MNGETKPKNKEKQTKEGKEETIEKYRLSQGRMNNYKKEVKDRLTQKEDIDIMTINKIMKESAARKTPGSENKNNKRKSRRER